MALNCTKKFAHLTDDSASGRRDGAKHDTVANADRSELIVGRRANERVDRLDDLLLRVQVEEEIELEDLLPALLDRQENDPAICSRSGCASTVNRHTRDR